jgi:hypothetical protein
MNASYKYIIASIAITLVVATVMYNKKHTEKKKTSYVSVGIDDSLPLNNQMAYTQSSTGLVSRGSSSSLQSAETLSINSEVKKPEAITEKDEKNNRVEKQDDELTEEELERKKWALVKKYSSQLPTIYDKGKIGGRDVVGSSLEVMKKEADAGYRAAKANYAAASLIKMKKARAELKEEDIELWKDRLKEPYSYYRDAAIAGIASAAVELGCEYFLPPYRDELEGLTWILIGIKLGRRGICNYRMPSDEKIYMQAFERAIFYLDYYDFNTVKNNDM